MAIAFTFNTVTLIGVGYWADNCASAVDSLARVDRDGILTNTGQLTGRAIRLQGRIVQDSEDNMRAAWAAILAGLYDDDGGNVKAALTAFNDRQIVAQVLRQTVDFNKQTANLHTADYTIDFITDDSYWRATSTTPKLDVTLSTGGTQTIAAADMGDAVCWPVITLSSATGLDSDIVLTNTTTGAVWTYGANLAAGHSLVVDMELHTVTDNGTSVINNVDHPNAEWWPFRGGVENVITLAFAGGANDASLSTVYYKRYYNM